MSERDEVLNHQEEENKEVTQEQNTSEELENKKEQDTTEEQESQEQEEIQENVDKQRQNKINEKVQGLVNNINNAVKKIQMIVHAILNTIIGIGLFLISPVGLIVEALLITVLVISSGAQVYGPNNMQNDKVSTEAPDVDFISGSEREHAIGLYFANNGVNPSASAYLAKSFKDNHYINTTLDSNCNTECLIKMIQNNEISNLSIGGYQATDTEQWKDASNVVMKAYKANKQWYNSSIQLKAMMDVVNALGHTEGSKLFTLDSEDISGAKTAVRSEEDYDLTELVKYINDNRC